jgi:hypothetical protein
VTNSHDPAQLIAPEIFVFAKERKKVRPGTNGPAAFMWHTLTHAASTLHPRKFLPVFFSPESRENFIQKCYVDHDMTPPTHLSIDRFALAEAIEFLEEEGVELVAPDPVGYWGGSFIPARPTSGPAKIGTHAARTWHARWRRQGHDLGARGQAAGSVSTNSKEVSKGFRN